MASPIKTSNHSTDDTVDFSKSPDHEHKFKHRLIFDGCTHSGLRKLNETSMLSISTAKDSNGTIQFDTNDICKAEDFDLKWFSNKYSNIGKINSHMEYYDLLDLKAEENSCSIILTLNTLHEINDKLRNIMKNDLCKVPFMSHSSFESVCSDNALLEKKLSTLKSISIHMEQTSKILLLVYLLQTSINQRDVEDFNIVIEHLYYLSFFRRFNDSLITVLDELSMFAQEERENCENNQHEIENLFILSTTFFDEDLNQRSKMYYLCFLCNLQWKSNNIYSSRFDQFKQKISKKLTSCINWREFVHCLNLTNSKIQISPKFRKESNTDFDIVDKNCEFSHSSEIESKFFESWIEMSMGSTKDSSKAENHKALAVLNAITSSKSRITFEALMKIYSNSAEFLEAINKSNILDSIQHAVHMESPRSTSSEFNFSEDARSKIEIGNFDQIDNKSMSASKELFEDYFIEIFSIEQSRFQQNDYVFNNFKLETDGIFKPSAGQSIVADDGCDSHDDDECWCISDSDIEIVVDQPDMSSKCKESIKHDDEFSNHTRSCSKDKEGGFNTSRAYTKNIKNNKYISAKFNKSNQNSGKRALLSSLIVSKNRMGKNSITQRKKKSFNLFAGLIRLCCIKK